MRNTIDREHEVLLTNGELPLLLKMRQMLSDIPTVRLMRELSHRGVTRFVVDDRLLFELTSEVEANRQRIGQDTYNDGGGIKFRGREILREHDFQNEHTPPRIVN